MRNWLDALSPREVARTRGLVVAGQRLVARRHQCLDLGILAGHQALDRRRLERHLPAGRRRSPASAMFSAGAVPVLVTTIGIELCCPATARALNNPSRPEIWSCGWPTTSSASSVLCRSVLRLDGDLDREMTGIDRARRTDLQLDVLGLAGLDRDRGQLLGAIGLGERGLEIGGRFAQRSWRRDCGPQSFLIVSVYSKFDFGVPRSDGRFDFTVSLAGSSLASATAIGSCRAWCPALRP